MIFEIQFHKILCKSENRITSLQHRLLGNHFEDVPPLDS